VQRRVEKYKAVPLKTVEGKVIWIKVCVTDNIKWTRPEGAPTHKVKAGVSSAQPYILLPSIDLLFTAERMAKPFLTRRHLHNSAIALCSVAPLSPSPSPREQQVGDCLYGNADTPFLPCWVSHGHAATFACRAHRITDNSNPIVLRYTLSSRPFLHSSLRAPPTFFSSSSSLQSPYGSLVIVKT